MIWLCLRLGKRAERAFAHRDAPEFPGPHARARQRAYFDAFRDLVAPCFGNGPLIRVPAPNRDPQAALQALEAALARLDRQLV